uniref:NEMO protein n=1 Tax=Urechis unicinctus TaxID=6432 RepID=A0A1B0VEH6_UREUN|nr:NEMO protein [Urechis unicinctus]
MGSINNAKLIDSLRASEGEMTRLKLERRNSRGSLETTAPLSREWINPREEPSSSPGAKQRHNQQQEVSSMREQIVSLMAELKEAHSKSEALNTEKQDIILRLSDVEKKCQQQHQDLKQTRLDDDTLIQTLRNNIKELEEKINSHKSNTHRLNMAMEDNQCRYTQLCTDYHQLLQEYENYKMSSLTLTQKRELEEKVDNLTAQLVTAEEALNTKDRLVRDLNQSQRRSQADLDTLGLYKTQAELYQQDFEDERNAHLQLQKDNEKLKKENQQSKVTLKQLQDQLMQMTHSQLGMAQTPHQRIRLPFQPPNSAAAYQQASHSGLNTDAARDQALGMEYPPPSQYTTTPRYHYPTMPPNHRPWNAPGNGFDQCDADIQLTGPDKVRNVDLDSIEASSTAPGHTGPVGPPLNKEHMLGPNKGDLQTVPGNTGPVNFQPAVKLSTSQQSKMFTVSKASALMTSDADMKINADSDKSGMDKAGQVAVSQAYKLEYDEGTKLAVERIDLPERQQKVEEEKQRSSAPDDPRSGGDLACPNCSLLHRDIDALNDHLELCLEFTF